MKFAREEKEAMTLSEIAEILRQGDRIIVAAHARPDGDAIGSSVALGTSLALLGKRVAILNEDPVPETLHFLEGSELVVAPDTLDFEPAIFVALDTANHERLGPSVIAAGAAAHTLINIDHHVSNTGYGDLVHVEPEAPAAGAILYGLLSKSGFPMDEKVCSALYAAISSDTGSFRFPATTARTLEIASRLVEGGAKPSRIADGLYSGFPKRRLELAQALFASLQIESEDRIASWALSLAEAGRIGYCPGDAEGLVDMLRSVRRVIAAVYFEEQGDGTVRVSARSREGGVDVSEICAEFGGGGHRNAAGAQLEGPLETARRRFTNAISKQL